MLSSCCCMSLRTAGKIIGWINLVGSLISTVVVIVMLSLIRPEEGHKFLGFAAQYVVSFYLTITIFSLLIAVFLIWGITKERHLLMLPWIICSAISLTSSSFFNLFTFIFSLCQASSIGGYMPLLALFLFVPLAFGIYIHFAIYSLYKQIQYSSLQKCALGHHSESIAMSTSGGINFVKV